jgi:putative aminopeptidase FrvX
MLKEQPTIGNEQLHLLERLCNASAVSGNEAEVRKIVSDELKPHADEVTVDALGNVLVTQKGSGKNCSKVMLDAHMDEVGFILVSDEGDGLYAFQAVGGLDPRYLPGKPVLVGRDHLPGVIGIKPIHLASEEELKQKPSIDSLRIDLGPSGKAKAGDYATFATRFKRTGPSVMAKAIDDRIGVATLIELVKHAPANINLLAAFTVQEEVGLRGAGVAAYAFEPDLAIAIDATAAHDRPNWDGSENPFYNTKLGFGPAIYIYDAGTINDPRLVGFLKETAEAEGIPYQIRQPGRGKTDATAIQRSRAGVPVVSVSVPNRYPHSPVSISRVDDWNNTLKLLYCALGRIKPQLL